jgi:hypothetical protein
MRSCALFVVALVVLICSTGYSQADFRLNCRLINPAYTLYRQHCKSQTRIVNIRCRDRADCLVVKKFIAAAAIPKPRIYDGPSATTSRNSTTSGLGGALGATLSGTSNSLSATRDAVGGTVSSVGTTASGATSGLGNTVDGAISSVGSIVNGL